MSSFGEGLKIHLKNLNGKKLIITIGFCLSLGTFCMTGCKTNNLVPEHTKNYEKNNGGSNESTSPSSQTGGGEP